MLSTPSSATTRLARDRRQLKRTLRWPVHVGLALMLAWFGGLGTWAATAPLAGAAIAPGVIGPVGSRRTVQHLEGGIIRELKVADGDRVAAGEPLLVLEDISARATRDAALARVRSLWAIEARLAAEATGAATIRFPDPLAEAADSDPDVAEAIADQRGRFDVRRRTQEGRKAILRQRIGQLEQEIAGLAAQIVSQDRQLSLIGHEIGNVEDMVDRGLERLPRLLSLQRQEAEISGDRAQNHAAIARARQAIGEAELEVLDLDARREDEVTDELSKVRAELAEVEEELRASEDVLARTILVAPIAGTVVDLRFHTDGGVVGPGEPILDIVPAEEDLVIEARVAPIDIDNVAPGQTAQVHLTAFRQRNLPRIDGTVRHVSADRLLDEGSNQPYFLARVEVDRERLAALGPGLDLVSGMPAEVMILTGERTALGYLTDPLIDTVRRSLREE